MLPAVDSINAFTVSAVDNTEILSAADTMHRNTFSSTYLVAYHNSALIS